VIIHNDSVDLLTTAVPPLQEQRSVLRQLRSELLRLYRPHIQEDPGPIRLMARLVAELELECRKRNIAQEVIRSEIVNRTIGDVNLRQITECEGTAGGPNDYRLLADEIGIALPGEQLCGYTATGETYLWLRQQMMECERLLLAHNYDPRMYDIYGMGNPLLREWLAQYMQQQWGLPTTWEQLYLGLGAMDSIDKVLRGLAHRYRAQNIPNFGILFPEPGFAVPEWQARSYGYQLHCFPTREEDRFKLTAEQLDQQLQASPNIQLIYLTVTNNPTTFAYSANELDALHTVLRHYRENGRPILLLADLAYIGTGKPADDLARMTTFMPADVWQHTILVSSYSKTCSLTGERLGWVVCGDPKIATAISPSWSNSTATLPGEWQLRFMAYHRLLQERPWLMDKLRNFYRLRRQRLIAQLRDINAQQHLFIEIYLDDDATVYNWSKLAAGEDAFSLFEKTGIASVPGSGFGYSDEYIRCSIGCIPVT